MRRPSERTIRILKMIALGAIVVGVGAAPSPRAMTSMFKSLKMKDSPNNRKWIRRKLYGLHERQYVDVRSGEYTLSEFGNRIVEGNRLWALLIPRPAKWDGVWHIVVFDIPKEKSDIRIPFVRLLQNLGLIYYQRSVWIHPYPCEDEVREIAVFHDIMPFVSFIKAVHVDGSHILRKHFELAS